MGLLNQISFASNFIITQYKFILILFSLTVYDRLNFIYVCNFLNMTPVVIWTLSMQLIFAVMEFVTNHSWSTGQVYLSNEQLTTSLPPPNSCILLILAS